MSKKKKEIKEEKKKKNRKKTEYIPLRGILGNATDYNIYPMNLKERAIGFFMGFAGGFVVIYVFFRVYVMSIAGGILMGYLFQKPFQNILIKRRKRTLLLQFKDMLEALSASYSAGMNTQTAFADAGKDLENIYGKKADITKEIQIINVGIKNNFIVEELLFDFAKRSGLEDIESFANIFSICNRQGANLKKVISDSRDIINDKIEIEIEIDTMLAGNRNQLNIMMVMPLIIMLSLSGMGTMSAVTNNSVNVIVKIGVLILFAIAYKMGRKIVDIKL